MSPGLNPKLSEQASQLQKTSGRTGQHANLSSKSRITVLKLKCTPGSYKQIHFLWKTLPANLCAAQKSTFSPGSSLHIAGISLLQCQRPFVWKLEVERLILWPQQWLKEWHDVHVGEKILQIINIHQSFWVPTGSWGPRVVSTVQGSIPEGQCVEITEAMETKYALTAAQLSQSLNYQVPCRHEILHPRPKVAADVGSFTHL